MTAIENRFTAVVKLGELLRAYTDRDGRESAADKRWIEALDKAVRQAGLENGWFTRENVEYALKNWGLLLKAEGLKQWLAKYAIEDPKPKTVALITAGNIPLVGFHDFLSTLLTGHRLLVKCASNDKVLLPFLAQILQHHCPELETEIVFSEGRLEGFDAVIATGSNNTSRYFEYYFGKKPHIIRKNRNSIAVLSGDETEGDLEGLARDMLQYFGLGCRSVSKLYVPRDYNFDPFFSALYEYRDLAQHAKYANNYDYNKAVYLMSEFPILENGFFMIKEDKAMASPIAAAFYEYYDNPAELSNQLRAAADEIQCVVSRGFTADEINFGQSQSPGLADYADGVDTVEFLLTISQN